MADKLDNPLDDDLLRELGLEPRSAPKVVKETPVQNKSTPPPPLVSRQQKEVLPKFKQPPVPAVSDQEKDISRDLKNLTEDMPVQIVAILGKKTMTLRDVIALKQGEIVDLQKKPQEFVDLVANGKLIGRGELVLIDNQLGIQIKQLVN